MSMNVLNNYAKRINDLHEKISLSLKNTVDDARDLGELLSAVKESIGHGSFEKWIADNTHISKRTAQNYMDLFIYKTANVADLQEAYAQIETLKQQEHRKEQERKDSLIRQYKKTGVKPDGWDRSCDYEYKKWHDESERNERVRIAVEKKEKEYQSKPKEGFSILLDTVNQFVDAEKEKQNFRKRITTGADNQHTFLDIIDNYLLTLPDDKRRLEACSNIIKHCRAYAVKYNRESVK